MTMSEGKEEWRVMSGGGTVLNRSMRLSNIMFEQRPKGSEEDICVD